MTQEEIDTKVKAWVDQIRMKERIKAIENNQKAIEAVRRLRGKSLEDKAITEAIKKAVREHKWFNLKLAFKAWWKSL